MSAATAPRGLAVQRSGDARFDVRWRWCNNRQHVRQHDGVGLRVRKVEGAVMASTACASHSLASFRAACADSIGTCMRTSVNVPTTLSPSGSKERLCLCEPGLGDAEQDPFGAELFELSWELGPGCAGAEHDPAREAVVDEPVHQASVAGASVGLGAPTSACIAGRCSWNTSWPPGWVELDVGAAVAQLRRQRARALQRGHRAAFRIADEHPPAGEVCLVDIR